MNDILELPFVADNKPGRRSKNRCFWQVSPTGDYETDCATGKSYSQMAVKFARENGNESCFISWMVNDMNLDDVSGIEVGFLSGIAKGAIENDRLTGGIS